MRPFLRRLTLLTILLAGVTPGPVRAGLVVSSETVSAKPGDTGIVQLLLTNNSAAAETLSAFSVDVALSGANVRFTAVDDQTVPVYVFSGFGTGTLTFDPFPNTGLVVSDLDLDPSGFVSLAPGLTLGLGRLSFEVDPTAAGGLRPITFLPGVTTQLYDDTGNPYPDTDVSFISGGIDVQGAVSVVPEPASAVLLLVGAGCALAAARRRKRPR